MVLRRTGKSEPEPERPRSTPTPYTGTGDTSIIANGTKVDGDCETSGSLRIEGHVTGDVRANRLHISRTGRIDGDVSGPGGGAGEDTVVVEGQVQGEVRAPRVEIGQGGSVGGGLQVTEAVVRGRIAGPVIAEKRLLLEETAVVDGDVTANRLALKEGGQVFGTIRIGERAGGSSRPAGGASRETAPSSMAATSSSGETGERERGSEERAPGARSG